LNAEDEDTKLEISISALEDEDITMLDIQTLENEDIMLL
jgi:hypothetical protein